MEEVLAFVVSPRSKSQISDCTKNDAVSWLAEYLYMEHEDTFIQVAKTKGLILARKMSAIEAIAMWVDANVTVTAIKLILRHLKAFFGFPIQVPMRELKDVGKNYVEPRYGKYKYAKNGPGKKLETVEYWVQDFPIALAADIETCLEEKYDPISNPFPTFGYETRRFGPEGHGVR